MNKSRLAEIVEELNNVENDYSKQVNDNVESMCCIEKWVEQEIYKTQQNEDYLESCLVFCFDDIENELLFQGIGKNIIQIHSGNEFKQINSHKLELNLLDESSYIKLNDWISSNRIEINEIVNCFCLSEREIPDQNLSDYTIDCLLFLSKHVLLGKSWDIFFFYSKKNNVWNATCSAIGAFFRVLSNENSRVSCHSIELSSVNDLNKELINNERKSQNLEVKYINDKRFIKKLELTELIDTNDRLLINEGTYIIIGGLGGLGRIVASYLISKFNANVIACSRNYNHDLIQDIKLEINEKGGNPEKFRFYSCDITSEEETDKFISYIYEEERKINGIIHCAAAMNDSMIIKKEKHDFDNVINSKVNSINQVEMIAKECNSDFILYFSSIAALVGTIGQCDYAYANSFLNSYASEQNSIRAKVISIAWPLWESKGMHADKHVSNQIKNTGFSILTQEQGMNVFEKILNSGKVGTFIIFYGKKEEIIKTLDLKKEGKEWGENVMKLETKFEGNGKKNIYLFLKQTIASVTKHQITEIDDYECFENLGIDSVKMIDIIMKMEEKLGSLPKTLFFEYQSLDQLAEYVEDNYLHLFNQEKKDTESIIKSQLDEPIYKKQENVIVQSNCQVENNNENEPIAIIGFDGKFPCADNAEEYWKVLSEGMDCIIEVPKERWDYNSFYSKNDTKPGMTNCKWGGFLNKPEYFDSEFFNYSPIEATMIDPQERIFLETVWNTMENAGYTRNQLKEETVGVYVGVAWGHYQFYETKVEDYTLSPVSSFSSIANRVSYFMDLKGPSMAVDTMCSSSGTAIHLACESIRSGESTLAFAGGVNLTVHPAKYKVLSTKNYLSSEGKCRSFGEGGDGYVPGEGVGVLLLKPLSKAINDGDHIEAVILATGVNHGGKATGYSVPSPNAQGDLIKKTIEKANIKPTDISYIEAHGTGTNLGDPIEILGLSKGLNIKENYADEYLLGSVKSNIGHLESAAAVSGLIKIILQMKHNMIVPSLHSENLNKEIDFDKLPFKVVQQLQCWDKREEHKNEKIELYSAISSFGAGGSNSFTILGKLAEDTDKRRFLSTKQVVVISALSEKALHSNIFALKEFIDKQSNMNINNLVDMCYTLQLGREEMPYRAAFVVNSIATLQNEITKYIEDGRADNCYIGFLEKKHLVKNTQLMDNTTAIHVKNQEVDKLAEDWVSGKYIDWAKLYENEVFKPKKIALPTYNFQKSKYWILDYNNDAHRKVNIDLIHPMIDLNNSTIDRQIYKKRLYGNEVYLSNHIVNNKVLMPGAAFLELSRAAAQLALIDIGTVKTISNIVFKRPLVVDEPVDIVVECYPKKGGLLFEIKEEWDKDLIYCNGEISYLGNKINYIDEECNLLTDDIDASIEKDELYTMLEKAGFCYGDYYQCIQKISRIDDTVVAKLTIDEDIANENSFYELKPSLIDCALQSASILLNSVEDGNKFIPSKIENIIIYGKMTNTCTTIAKTISSSQSGYVFNIKIYDEKGRMCVQICNYTIETYDKSEKIAKETTELRVESNIVNDNTIRLKVVDFVKHSISKEIGTDASSLKESDDFEKYGVDSVITMRITDRLNKVFNTLPTTLLFEYKSVGSLIEFLLTDYYEVAAQYFGDGKMNIESRNIENEKKDIPDIDRKNNKNSLIGKYNGFSEDIAIIGISGRYPQADNLDIFWNNMANGKDCIEEVPLERWDYRPLYSPDKNEKGKISSKWGGFINGAEEFDADFFGIVPIQAAIMDPQERIYLQAAWNCIEDAGYTVKALENYTVGVYTGEMWGCYQKVGVEETLKGNVMSLSSSFASTSNKISYIMNFHGPSMTVDTMCSSSLTAIHLACKAIGDGSVDMAIAGGVNLSLHPDKYISLSQGKFLSSNGRCSSFGEGGDGYVPGEGVGTILLKKVSQAEKDGDHIYAVIKATSINHGGRSNAYFVPNVTEQKNLIVGALKNADISPRTISTVEAHGTGTALGDPIEIEGFNKAYRTYTKDKQYCAIGSVKSNIGHLESAAGIAAITKVVLEMKHKKLVPSLHSDVLNSKIDFPNSPFYVQHEYCDWNKPIINENGQMVEYPRRGAISAFGAGGTNVHIILEEYEQEQDQINIQETERILVFSAKNKERLEELLQNFILFLEQQDFSNQSDENRFMYDMENNLLSGRQHFNCRIAIIAEKIDEVISIIESYLSNKREKNLFIGDTNTNSLADELFEDEEGRYYLSTLIKKKNLQKIAKLWVDKVEFDFIPFIGEQYKKISLPTYPFEKRLITPPKVKNEMQERKVSLHSMVDNNVSKILNQQFVKQFSGNEFYLKDHIINGHSILPAAAYLEMLRASGEFSVQQGVVSQITNVVWQRPLVLDNSTVDAYINLNPQGDEVLCQIQTVNHMGVHLVHCTGNLELVKYDPRWKSQEKVDLNLYKEVCIVEVDGNDFYKEFEKTNFNYGKRLQFINKILVSESADYAITILNDPNELFEKEKYTLHPAILDSGIQAVAALINDHTRSYLPHSVDKVEILESLDNVRYVIIQKKNKTTDTISFDLEFVDDEGKTLLKFDHLSVKEQKVNEKEDLIKYFTPVMEEVVNLPKNNEKTKFIILDTSHALYSSMKQIGEDVLLVRPGQVRNKISQTEYEICISNEQDYKWLFQESVNSTRPTCIIYNLNSAQDMEFDIAYATEFFEFIKAVVSSGLRNTIKLFNVFGGDIQSKDNLRINPMYLACAGLLKTAGMEMQKLFCKNIAFDNSIKNNSKQLAEYLRDELTFGEENVEEIYYTHNEKRFIRTLKDLLVSNIKQSSIKQNGVYYIIGGLKGVGLKFAEYLAATYNVNLVISGRSEMSTENEKTLEHLQKISKSVLYIQADVNEFQDMKNSVELIKSTYGHIDGIIYSAGIKQDELIINKASDTFKHIIETKTLGIQNTCKALDNDQIDFIVTFSSLAGLMGNMGQSDYAYANNYLDSYATVEGINGKKIISINWPYWLDGGMRLKDSEIESMKRRNNMVPLQTKDGLQAFEYSITNVDSMHQLFVMALDSEPKNLEIKEVKEVQKKVEERVVKNNTETKGDSATEAAKKYLRNVISEETQIEVSRIKGNEAFEAYGLDSVMIMNITANMEKEFGALPKTLLYENHNIDELNDYLEKNHSTEYYNLFGASQLTQTESVEIGVSEVEYESDEVLEYTAERERITFNQSINNNTVVTNNVCNDDIAIVGIVVKAPEADDIHKYWDNLIQNKNCISEIPEERWDYRPYYSETKGEIGKTYCKYGGFINDIDKFDPLFFNMAPSNAAFIEPQERMMLQEVWHLFENAGYAVSNLKNRNVGVFVGAMWQQYQMLLMNGPAQGMIPSLLSNLANRISSYYDLNGPSIALDTMCSGSLTALHLAINSIRNGECSSAIVAGINTSIHPSKYINLSQGGLLSTDARCKPFGKGADGYIPAEGLGIVMIKPLSQAIADNDNIKMVIKASEMMHSGKGGGFMVPNPKVQAQVIKNAINKANVPIQSINYIEAQGTCTEVGDVIEVKGMSDAFSNFTNEHQICAIGSAKYHIGHAEAASGILAVAKIAMQMKNRLIPGILNEDDINEDIILQDSPFYIPQQNCVWKPYNLNGESYPLTAGLNGFGGGGSYLHFILQEYNETAIECKQVRNAPNAFILSAKNIKTLNQMVLNFEDYINSEFIITNCESNTYDKIVNIISTITGVSKSVINAESLLSELNISDKHYIELLKEINIEFNTKMEYEDFINLLSIKDIVDNVPCNGIKEDGIRLEQIAYSLQKGRESMAERVVFIAKSAQELLNAIQKCRKQEKFTGVFYGLKDMETCDPELDNLINEWMEQKEVNWDTLYKLSCPKKIILPEYPFEKVSYWLPKEIMMNYKSKGDNSDLYIEKNKDNHNLELLDECDKIAELIASTLGISAETLDFDTSFKNYGLDSYLGLKITQDISELYGHPIDISILEEYDTVNKLYENVIANYANISRVDEENVDEDKIDNTELTKLILMQLENGEIDVNEAIKIENEALE